MSPEMNWLVVASMVGLLLVTALSASKTREWRFLVSVIVGLGAFSFFLNQMFGFPLVHVIAMGPEAHGVLWVALYLCMLTGMVAQYAYRHFVIPRRQRKKWDWGLFIAPVFASPIVFIPLATSCLSAGLDLENINTTRFMIFIVAFQNGFFWKEFFDLKQKEETNQR
jgi:hypothetical protein